MPEAVINGIRLCYEQDGTGRPNVWIHGAASSTPVWADAVARSE